jgi:uncharacterized protein YciI
MDPTVQSALIGFGGVIIGSVLGSLLSIIPQYFRDRRERIDKQRNAHLEHLRYILQQLLPLGPIFFKHDDEAEYIKTVASAIALLHATGNKDYIRMSEHLRDDVTIARSFFYHILKEIGTELSQS